MNTVIVRILFTLMMLAFAGRAVAIDWQERVELGALFADAGVQGAFVLYDVTAERFLGHNRARAETRFIPASTFKLVNSLIGLSVGAVVTSPDSDRHDGRGERIYAFALNIDMPLSADAAKRLALGKACLRALGIL
jgi:beta-lactamase class D